MLQALASGAARRGERGARPLGGFGIAGTGAALRGTAPSLSPSDNLLFSDTVLQEEPFAGSPCQPCSPTECGRAAGRVAGLGPAVSSPTGMPGSQLCVPFTPVPIQLPALPWVPALTRER